MCYHISLAAGAEELARRFGRKTDLVENSDLHTMYVPFRTSRIR